jgi:hypothetical protein
MDRAQRIEPAIALIEQSVPPLRVTYPRIAEECGLDTSTVARMVRASGHLAALVAKANDSKMERQLRWTAECMLAEGRPLLSTFWAARAKLPITADVHRAMCALASQLAAEGFATGPRWAAAKGGPVRTRHPKDK